jgi:phage terminase large subunit-like protein
VTTPALSVADFFAQNFRHRKGPAAGQPFVLEPWHADFVDERYRLDERGNRIYKRAILGVPRENGKSPIAAGVGVYELMTRTRARHHLRRCGLRPGRRRLRVRGVYSRPRRP